MKKILFILQLPPPIHGASLMNSYVIGSEIINRNYKTEIINLQFSSALNEIEKFSILKVLKAIYFAFKIFFKIITSRPDLVYFTLSPGGYAFYRDVVYVLILKSFKLKILFHLHGKGIKKGSEKNSLNKALYKFVFKNTHVICLTNSLTTDIKHVYKGKPFIVPCGIPEINKDIIYNSNSNNVPQILYLSNYIENKGILKLISALDIVNKKGYTFKARLVGAPSDLTIQDVKNYVKQRELENSVEVTGPKYGDQKYSEFSSSDIFAFPTFYSNETFGLVNLEAMQFGLPIITTNEGGIAEVVLNEHTGFVIQPKNIEELSDKLIILINDKQLRDKMGKAGKDRFLENYTLFHFENNIKSVFDNLLTEDKLPLQTS